MPLFRCLNCTRKQPLNAPAVEFEAKTIGPCPSCMAPASLVVQLETIHFDPPTAIEGKGHNAAACNPAIKIGRSGLLMSGEPSAVTCRACRKTPVWSEQMELRGVPVVPAELDFVVEPPPKPEKP